jgi:hypothetical protein
MPDPIIATYAGAGRVQVAAGDRCYQADARTALAQPGASLCPLEWIAAALAA